MNDHISNDIMLSHCASRITQHARKINELLRDGKLRELELVLSTIHESAHQGIYRCMDLAFRKPGEAQKA